MGKDDQRETGPKIHRRRKSEIISGISVAMLTALFGFVWKFRGDVEQMVKDAVELERIRAQYVEQEIRSDLRQLTTICLTPHKR